MHESITERAVSHSLTDSPPSRAPADQGSRDLGSKGSGKSSNSPSMPTSRNAPAERRPDVDGWIAAVLLAFAGYLDRVGPAIGAQLDVATHLRWLADGTTDLAALLELDTPLPADLAPRITTYGGRDDRWRLNGHTVQHWQLHFGEHFIADTSSPEHLNVWQRALSIREVTR